MKKLIAICAILLSQYDAQALVVRGECHNPASRKSCSQDYYLRYYMLTNDLTKRAETLDKTLSRLEKLMDDGEGTGCRSELSQLTYMMRGDSGAELGAGLRGYAGLLRTIREGNFTDVQEVRGDLDAINEASGNIERAINAGSCEASASEE